MKIMKTTLTLVMSGCLAITLVASQSRSAADQYEEAFRLEEVKGDLKGAIELYKKLAENRNRQIAARALFRLAESYRKLGEADARAVYERVVREFADQVESATAARAQLAALPRPGDASAGIQARRVWEGALVNAQNDISPDGRYLVFPGGGGSEGRSDLYVRDLSTGLNRRLTAESATIIPGTPFFSPDGEQVAYGFGTRDPAGVSGGSAAHIRLVTLNGTSRVLHSSNEWGHVSPHDWSADGKQIVAVARRDPIVTSSPTYMVLVSVADGSIRPFKPYPGTPFSRLSLSPDARYVVYDYPAQGTSGQADIVIVDTARGEETPLVRRASDDRNPFFTPDGAGVVFFSNEGGSIGLWYQRVAQGQAQGSPVLLKSDLGNPLGIGFTTNGTFYYHASDVPQPKLYTATLDIENGAVTIPASVVTQRPALSVLWSPDGRYLAYRSYRPPWRSTPDAEIIAIRALDTGEERDFAPGLGPLGLTSWSPDSRSLLIRGGLAPRASFYRFDVETGARTLLFSDTSGWNSVSERWFPNQESVTYVREDSSGRSIVVRQLETGRELELYKPPASTQLSRQLAVSANGRHIAFHATNLETRTMSVMVMTVTGEKPRELGPPVALPEAIDQIFAVTPDGRYVLYSSRNRDSGIFKFWRVPVDGGAPKEIPFPLRIRREFDFYMVSLHPDGKQIAFAAEAPAPATRTVWALENFLPKASAER